jgi:hypothetical protein
LAVGKQKQALQKEVVMAGILKKWFGGSSAPKAAKARPSVRLQLEQLDQRLLLSNTGTISSVFANVGPRYGGAWGNVMFYIGRDHNLYECYLADYAVRLDGFDGYHGDLQVSAGVDANGNPVAYVLNDHGSLWALTTAELYHWDWMGGGWWAPSIINETHVADNVIYNPQGGWSTFSASLSTNTGPQAPGVFFISNHYDYFYQLGQGAPLQISASPVDMQISAGADAGGNKVAYVRNAIDGNCYEYHAAGGWWSQVTTGHDVAQVVGGFYGEAFFLFHVGWSDTKLTMWRAGIFYDLADNVNQVSVSGPYVDYVQNGNAMQFNDRTWQTYFLASNVREVSAGALGEDYFVDGSNNLYWKNTQRDGSVWQDGDNVL